MKRLFVTLISGLLFVTSGFSCEVIRAAFDVGNSSTKMRVYKVDSCQNTIIEQVCKGKRSVSYKADLKNSKELKKSTIREGLKALNELKKQAVNCGAEAFAGIATSAFRDAKNREEAIKKLAKSDINLQVITQEEEALLEFAAAIKKAGYEKNEKVCTWGIGSSSMQLTCQGPEGVSKIYLGALASISFKNEVLKLKDEEAQSPNPIKVKDYISGNNVVAKEAMKAWYKLNGSLKGYNVLGIGGVFYYSVAGAKEKTVTLEEVGELVIERINKTDEELGGGKHVATSATNMILVQAFMSVLGIDEVKVIDINLTEGLAVSSSYWKPISKRADQ